jgi:hypothetical protein
MKIYVVKTSSDEYSFTDDAHCYISYNFNLNNPKLIFLHSYNKLGTRYRATLERRITVRMKRSSNKLIVKRYLISSWLNRLPQTIIIDSKKLQLEQGLSFLSSRK